ncbi:hypothetical protein M422DRAFT_34040, partial [Sphaerobolus stellatus SS14]
MGASYLEYRDEDASRNDEKADAKQQPRNKRRVVVGCMSKLALCCSTVYWPCVW